MAKHKEIMKDRASWAFLDQTAQDQHRHNMEHGIRTPDPQPFGHDLNRNAAFADWLHDHDDPRHVIVQNAKLEPEWESPIPFGQATSPIEHPNDPGRPHRAMFLNSYPRAFNDERTDSGVLLGAMWWQEDPVGTPYLPVLRWYAHVPRGLASGTGRSVRFTAPVTHEQLREFIRGLKGKAQQKQWVEFAQRQGWLPHKLARPAAEIGSTQHAKRLQIARQILNEAGIKPATVKAVIANGDRAGVLQMLHGDVHPALARYVAAWFGLLSGEKSLTVFHPASNGEDFLHVITTRYPPDQLSKYLRDSGAPQFSVENTGTGSRAYLYNPLGKYDVSHVLKGLPDAGHAKFTGFGSRIGSSSGAAPDARAAFRTIIRDFDSTSENPRQGSADVHPARLARKSYEIHPEETAFLDQLRKQPGDITTRLVYADWLDEHDRPGHAAAHRQVADPDWKPKSAYNVVTWPRGSWRWQDAFRVARYRPHLTRDDRWIWALDDYVSPKLSGPQLQRSWRDRLRTLPHGVRNGPVNDVTTADVAFHAPERLTNPRMKFDRDELSRIVKGMRDGR